MRRLGNPIPVWAKAAVRQLGFDSASLSYEPAKVETGISMNCLKVGISQRSGGRKKNRAVQSISTPKPTRDEPRSAVSRADGAIFESLPAAWITRMLSVGMWGTYGAIAAGLKQNSLWNSRKPDGT